MATRKTAAPIPWDQVIGQQSTISSLRTTLVAQRVASGYLFHGPAGVGKRTCAMAFAQVLLCHAPPEPDRACGECKSCRWLAAKRGLLSEHPDLLLPLKTTGGEERMIGDHEPLIALEPIQRLCERIHRGPANGPRRVAIVPEAHRLCRGQAEPANAFLKTLEEPPSTATIILTTSRPEALLETIISRTQSIRFRRLSATDIEGVLTSKGHPDSAAHLAASLSDGSLGRALEMLEGDLNDWRKKLAKYLLAFKSKDCPAFGLVLWKLAEEEGARYFEQEKAEGRAVAASDEDEEEEVADEAAAKSEAGWRRHVFTRLLDLCEVAFRDGLVRAAGGPEAELLQGDSEKLAQHLADRFGETGCEHVLEAFREARLATRLFIRGDLVGRVIAGKMAEAMGE